MNSARVRKQLSPTPTSPASPDELVRTGLGHHRLGQLTEASKCYARALGQNGQHPDALHLSGILARQQGDYAMSLLLINAAIEIAPLCSMYHQNLGSTLLRLNRRADAQASFRMSIQLNPNEVKAMQLLAESMKATGQTAEAEKLYRRAIKLRPGDSKLCLELGALLKNARQFDSALDVYRRTAKLFPDLLDAHIGVAATLFDARRFQEASTAFDKVLELAPDHVDAQNDKAVSLHILGEIDAARGLYLRVLNLDPNHIGALSNLGAMLLDRSELRASEVLLRRALGIDPNYLSALNNLGILLRKKNDVPGAIECFRRVLTVDPTHVDALCSIGFLHDCAGDEQGAIGYYQLALQADPTSAPARFNLSGYHLAAGDFQRGWTDFEERWNVRQFTAGRPIAPERKWKGEDLLGKRIFIHAEQGFGDTLQFIRYLPLLQQRGAEVTLEVQAPLFDLLKNTPGASLVVPRDGRALPEYDFHCGLMSLPGVFKTDLTNIPAGVPYVHANPEDVQTWAGRLEDTARTEPLGLRVGLVWSGNPEHARDRLRSIPLEKFRGALATEGVTFYSLQKGPGTSQIDELPLDLRPIPLGDDLINFTVTAAVVANLDLIITADTAVAHLAAAMGKTVWILIPMAADWRWLRNRTDNPWYPTVKLFRQTVFGQWTDVLDRVGLELSRLAAPYTRIPSSHSQIHLERTAARIAS